MTTAGTSASATLAHWARELTLDDVPASVRAAAARHLLDGLGTTLSAARRGLGQPAVTVARSLGGPPEASILGTTDRLSAPAAALANGVQLHALDFDDTHAVGLVHATAGVLPALVAAGQQHGADGAAVLLTAVAGYEAVCRITAASPHGFHARGLHATHIGAVLSSALITGLLAGDDTDVIVNALGIAGSAAGGLLEFLNSGSSTKQLHPGTAAMNGIIAARLAAAGATGPASVLEGDKGLYAALSARPADIASITEGLGSRWETTAIGIKPYPACQLMHNALEAATQVLPKLGNPSDVTRIVAEIHPDSVPTVAEPRAMKLTPRSAYGAKFSVQWSLAALLIDGQITADTYAAESIARPEVRELATRVELTTITRAAYAADAPGRVDIELADGRHLVGEVAASRGTIHAPMTDADVTEKFLANCGPTPAARELANAVLGLATLPGLEPLVTLAATVVSVAKEQHPA